MPTGWEGFKAAVLDVTIRLEQDRKRLDQSRLQAATAESDLVDMANSYAAMLGENGELDTLAADNPGDIAVQALKADKDRLLDRRAELKAQATAIKDAIDAA